MARSVLFRPGGPLACELARHAVALKVNDWIFCHGGLLPQHGKKISTCIFCMNQFSKIIIIHQIIP